MTPLFPGTMEGERSPTRWVVKSCILSDTYSHKPILLNTITNRYIQSQTDTVKYSHKKYCLIQSHIDTV